MRHYHQPDFGTLKLHLSALLNYAKFVRDKQSVKQRYQDRMSALIEEQAALEQSREQLQTMHNELQIKKQQEAPAVKLLQNEVDQLTLQKDEKAKIQKEREHEAQIIDQKLNELKHQLDTLEATVASRKEENAKVQAQIVRSPEKVKKNLDTMGVQAATAKDDVEKVKEQLRILQTRGHSLSKIAGKVTKRTKTITECLDLLMQEKAMGKEVKDLRDQIIQNDKAIKELKDSEDRLLHLFKAGEDKLYRLQREYEHKKSQAEHLISRGQAERANLLASSVQERDKHEGLMSRIAQTKQELDNMTRSHEKEIARFKHQMLLLEKAVKNYHQKLKDAMDSGSHIPGSVARLRPQAMLPSMEEPTPRRIASSPSLITPVQPVRHPRG